MVMRQFIALFSKRDREELINLGLGLLDGEDEFGPALRMALVNCLVGKAVRIRRGEYGLVRDNAWARHLEEIADKVLDTPI